MSFLTEHDRNRWDQSSSDPDALVLRLSFLREWSRRAHQFKSSPPPPGADPSDSPQFWESRLNSLIQADLKSLSFDSLSDQNLPTSSRPLRVTPPGWDRFDRKWEAAILTEGLARGWILWTLVCAVEVRQVMTFQTKLETLNPNHLIILATESATSPAIEGLNWKGRWTALARPGFTPPAIQGTDWSKSAICG